MILGFVAGISENGFQNTIIGGITGYSVFYLIYQFGRVLFKKIKIRGILYQANDPIGFGDVKLAAVTGLVLGWPSITTGLLAAVSIGGIVSLFIILNRLLTGKYKPYIQIPYGPNIIAGMIIAILLG